MINEKLEKQFEFIKLDLEKYNRCIILAGNGIHCSNTRIQFKNFIEKYQLPFVTTFLGRDYIDYDNPLNLGAIGIKGNRAANFALQNANYLLILGCSLTIPHIGYIHDQFAHKAKKVIIDIDQNVLNNQFVKLDVKINCDLKEFFNYMLK